MSFAGWHGHEPTWPNAAPHSNVCRVGGKEKKSYKLESSDAATYRVSESSLSIKHNHASVRVAYCSAYIPELKENPSVELFTSSVMRWGSIQAVQQLDRFVQRLRGVRQEQTPLVESLTHLHLMKLETQSYPGRHKVFIVD